MPYFSAASNAAVVPGKGTSKGGVARSVLPPSQVLGPGKFTLLVAEDNANDRTLLDQLLVSAGLASVRFVASGDAVIEYLTGGGKFADRVTHPYPHVLLLDLAMPHGHGLEVLQWMANHAELPLCSVYVLTGSRDPVLRRQAIGFGVAGYFQKPLSLAQISWILEDRMALMY